MAALIYVADDEANIRRLIQAYLRKEGYEVECFPDGESLLAATQRRSPSLIVLDVMMPGIDGLSVCAYLRQRSDVPILVISARDGEMDAVMALQKGGDDYLVKPFGMLEMTARIESLLRRAGMRAQGAEQTDALTYGDLTLNTRAHTAQCLGEPLSITPAEYDFLALVLRAPDRAFSRKELLETLWQCSLDVDTRAPDDLVKRLRRKLEAAGSRVRVEAVWGYGYRLAYKEENG